MIPQPDYGHFYKFAVSVGLILIALSALIPVVVLRDSGTLSTPASKIETLTPTAQKVVIAKQHQQRWVQDHYVWASGVLAVAGTAIVIYGASRWSKRQAVLDELDDTDLARRKLELQSMTAQEVERKEVEEALVEVAEERTEGTTDPTTSEPAEASRPPIAMADAQSRVHEIQVERRGIEASLAALLRRAFSSTHKIEQNVRVGKPTRTALEADFLLISQSARFVSHAVEFKHATTAKSIHNRLIEGISKAEAVARAATHSQGTPFRALFVLGLSEGVEISPAYLARCAEVVAQRRTSGINLEVLLMRRSVMDAVSADVFRQAVEIGRPNGDGFTAMI